MMETYVFFCFSFVIILHAEKQLKPYNIRLIQKETARCEGTGNN